MSFRHRLLDTVPVVVVLSLRIFVFVSTWWWRQYYGRWPAGVASSNSTNRTSDLLMQRFPANPISAFGKTRYPTVNSYPLFHIRVAHHQSFFSPNRLNNSFSPRHGNKENDHNSKSKGCLVSHCCAARDCDWNTKILCSEWTGTSSRLSWLNRWRKQFVPTKSNTRTCAEDSVRSSRCLTSCRWDNQSDIREALD